MKIFACFLLSPKGHTKESRLVITLHAASSLVDQSFPVKTRGECISIKSYECHA